VVPCPGAARAARALSVPARGLQRPAAIERRAIIDTTLIIENLSDTTTESDLIALFSGVGRVRGVKLPKDRTTGEPAGYALLELATEEGIDRAISRLDGRDLDGSTIRVGLAEGRTGLRAAGGTMWGAGHANSRPKGSRRGARRKKRGL